MKNNSYLHLNVKLLRIFHIGLLIFIFSSLLISERSYGLAWESTKESVLFEKGDLKGVKKHLKKVNYLQDQPDLISEAMRKAISSGNIELIIFLKHKGWLEYCQKSKCNLIIKASAYNKLDILKYFLAQGFDIIETDRFGTGLHHAVMYNHYEIVKFLVENGIDITKKNKKGKTALDIATRYRKPPLYGKPPGTPEKVIAYLKSKEKEYQKKKKKIQEGPKEIEK